VIVVVVVIVFRFGLSFRFGRVVLGRGRTHGRVASRVCGW
jgi:hypothetical protein